MVEGLGQMAYWNEFNRKIKKVIKVGIHNSFQNLLDVDQHKGLSATFPVTVVTGNRIHPRWFK